MANKDVFLRGPGEKVFLLGNEAISRAAAEAGVDVVSCYPGTPSSEVSDTLSDLAAEFGFDMEYSANEKVALEVALAAMMAGAKGLTAMKTAGVNVALDSLVGAAMLGGDGALVIVVSDDPSGHSSSPDQDSRYLAQCVYVPVLLPSSPVEAKEMTLYAFEISEKLHYPIIVRAVTRVSHMSQLVELGQIPYPKRDQKYVMEKGNERWRFVGLAGEIGRQKRGELIERYQAAQELFEKSRFNQVSGDSSSGIGIITSGASYHYTLEAVDILGIKPYIFKLGTIPLPEKKLSEFLSKIDRLMVVDEEDPFIEQAVAGLANEAKPGLKIYGKRNNYFPLQNEYNIPTVVKGICRALDIKPPVDYDEVLRKAQEAQSILVPRMPTFCAGCPHRAVNYALKKAIKKKHYYCMGDVGCYTLSCMPPFRTIDTNIAMGGGTGLACGLQYVVDDPVLAMIGDSTFFHAGLPPLVNAIHTNANFTLILMDNGATGMTGLQPHPGTDKRGGGKPGKKILAENVVRGMGVEDVRVVDPYDLKETQDALKEAIAFEGISVVITRRACILLARQERKVTGERAIPYFVDVEECEGCFICTEKFSCPAMYQEDESVKIDEVMCFGCGVCAQICPTGAIKQRG